MPPKAPEKKHFDTTNSDDTKEALHLVSQTIKELNAQLDKFANGSLKPQAPETKQLDTTMNSDDIKKSFHQFSQTIQDLLVELDKFESGFLRLERARGLVSAIKEVREMLCRTREVFFHNAVALVPGLRDLARTEARESETRGSSSKRFYIRSRYFEAPPSFTALPTVLKQLAKSFRLLHVRTDEFPESTEQGSRLKDLFSTLNDYLLYRASCARDHEDRLNTPVIQRYIHQFIFDLKIDFKKLASELNEFIANSIPAIRSEQARAATTLANILAAATLFSGVTASTLQISMGQSDQNNTILVVNTLLFTSLILSVGAALNCVLYGAFVRLLDVIKPLISSQSNYGKLPLWIDWWMDGSHSFLLGASILTFSAGLSVFTFSSNQAVYTPYIIIATMMLASAGLGAILIWILYKILMAPKEQADAIRYSGDSIHSESNKISSFPGRIAVCIKNALPWSLLRKLDHPQDDVEEGEKKIDEFDSEESPSPLTTKIQDGVSIGRKKKHDPDEINSAAALTKLILPAHEAVPETIEFECHGTIRNVEYSDDGKWLAISCVKEIEQSYESWTTVLDAKTLGSIGDIYHTEGGICGALKWSPSGKKLTVKLECRYDIWDLAANMVQSIHNLQWNVQVVWFDEDALLVTNCFNIIKMDLTGRETGLYEFKDTVVESIGIEREKNYLILLTHVLKSNTGVRSVRGRVEKRIVIYDMDRKQKIYQVPALEDISYVYPVPGTLDILITHRDQKAFQLWSLDAGIRGPGSTDRLKQTITPHHDPGDYIGPIRIGGNSNQYVFNVTKSGDIDIWRRESGKPYRTFSSSILQKEGVGCFSWRRSDDETATFATAGTESHTLLVWRGEEPRQVPETSDSPDLYIASVPRL